MDIDKLVLDSMNSLENMRIQNYMKLEHKHLKPKYIQLDKKDYYNKYHYLGIDLPGNRKHR